MTLLPLEKAAVFIGTEKSTTDVGSNVRFLLEAEEARKFYTSPIVLVGGINRGGLGSKNSIYRKSVHANAYGFLGILSLILIL